MMSHLEQPGETGQRGNRLKALSWALPGGCPPLPEFPCKVTPAGGGAVADLQRVQGNFPCPRFPVTFRPGMPRRGQPTLRMTCFQHLLSV